MERTHNGGIVLLHAVSKTNTEIMDSILKEWKSKGFEFKTLNELP
jgi:peptidoglycan-N-acetylmuramic acid deacetylase